MENTKDRKKIIVWIAAIIAAISGCSCAVTFNNIFHSSNVHIDSEQNATQQNDSTQFRGEINTK